jgi:hypothetical protein
MRERVKEEEEEFFSLGLWAMQKALLIHEIE